MQPRFRNFIAAVLLATGTAGGKAHADVVPACGLYTYRVEIVRIIDGDTVVADIDLGFNVWRHDEHLRLFGIDTPKASSVEGQAATAALEDRLAGQTVYICTIKAKGSDEEKTGSFGRYLAELYVEGENLNQWLLDNGYAKPWED